MFLLQYLIELMFLELDVDRFIPPEFDRSSIMHGIQISGFRHAP